MKIIFKETEEGTKCLFDTRSNQFFKGGCVKSEDSMLLETANALVRKSFKNIVETAQSYVYGEYGYVESMLAEKYLEMNPEIRTKVFESKEKIKTRVDKKTNYTGKKRGRKPSENKVEKPKVLDANGQPRKRGRPRKAVV
jgi:hypothetical protein